MQKKITFLFLFIFSLSLNAQCDLDFSDNIKFPFTFVSGTDIVNAATSGANLTRTQSFDIWDEGGSPLNCTAGSGANDITFELEVIGTFEMYGTDGVVKDLRAGTTHEIIQDGTGLKGKIPMGAATTNETTHGDVRGYRIKVTFANHLSILAGDVTTNVTSVNTAGGIFESMSLVYLNGAGVPYGTATYNGYYGAGSPGASITATCTAPTPSLTPWSTTGTGVYIAANTSTVKLDTPTNPCDATGGTTSSLDNADVAATTDAGLSASDVVGGFIFTVYTEDIAPSLASGANTSTSTAFTSTLNGMTISSAALPVELTDFSVNEKDGNVLLQWQTASEIDNDYFEIEHSVDGEIFNFIGKENGAGQTTQFTNYSFMHTRPSEGQNYYRLKQVDFDGQFEYSKIVSVNFRSQDKILIYPTLVQSDIMVDLPENAENTTYEIYTYTGQILQNGILENNSGQQKIYLGNLSNGTYFISLKNKTTTEVFKFVKVE